ncbi:S1C family serine protease [Paeniglutamicibacter psychrophenolicus]|uniref:S1C family serine protease n=1 Tax=Paeniglutamicibacter psychrophenolicus TaxID=257454 RepID=UPI0027861309|nr:trypsin-like peptidase domain-containing protein [Paeniglutamicibacter psychrophenolicus]MDQ0095336.1 putative serine protease PepD [Paeniglutamicibacter psychrophenolicus]
MSENQFEQPGTGRDPERQPESGAVPPRPATPPSTPASGSGDGAAGTEGTQPVSRIEGAADPTQALPRHSGNPDQDAPAPGASAQGAPAQGSATGAQPQHPYGAPAPAQQPAHAWNSTPQGGSPYGTPTAEEHASAFGAPLPPARNNSPKKFTSGALIVGMVAAAIIGAGGAVGANYVMNSNPTAAASSSTTPQGDVVINNPKNVTAVTAAAAKASPSVVTIDVAGNSEAGSGSGIILDKAGHILTNTHVVTLGGTTSSPKIAVRTSDGKVHDATVVGTDPLSDLAVIKIEAQDLVPAELGTSGSLNVGDTAIAIGAPLGLSGTVTDGIISTLNRTISVASSAVPKQSEGSDSNDNGNQFNFQFPGAPEQQQQQSSSEGSIFINVIQTDAAINHGNSGGALVDVNGNIIGVNVAIASSGSSAGSSGDSGSIGVGFAIPIDYAKRIANDIIDNGSATHGLLGVTVQAKAASANGGNSSSFSVGAEVKEVVADSPAAKADLKAGDVITGVDARSISDSTSLTAAIREIPAGGTTVVHYTRGGAAESTTVTVGETPAQ